MFVFLEHRAESDRCSWLGAWMKENCAVLLAGVSEQVDAAVCQDVNMLIQRLPQHAQRLNHHVTTPPSPFVFRAYRDSHHRRQSFPENTSFAWNGLFNQRVKGY